jgi:tetrahydromethanopterin S-methyltransferase subunit A
LNAIDWTAKAWGNVADDVIYRCWERTGILPDNEEVEQAMGIDTDANEENEVQLLIDQININSDDVITARSYIEIDSGSMTEMLDDDEIIAAVREAPEDDDEEDVSPPISNKIALESIQILYNYLEQNNDIEVNSQFVSGLRDLKWKIGRKQINSLKQANMDIYLNE